MKIVEWLKLSGSREKATKNLEREERREEEKGWEKRREEERLFQVGKAAASSPINKNLLIPLVWKLMDQSLSWAHFVLIGEALSCCDLCFVPLLLFGDRPFYRSVCAMACVPLGCLLDFPLQFSPSPLSSSLPQSDWLSSQPDRPSSRLPPPSDWVSIFLFAPPTVCASIFPSPPDPIRFPWVQCM